MPYIFHLKIIFTKILKRVLSILRVILHHKILLTSYYSVNAKNYSRGRTVRN